MRILLLASAVVGCFTAMPFVAEAAVGDCYLRVSGKTYLDGRCNIMLNKSGDFSIGMVDTGTPSKYFASVNAVDAASGKGDGFWNGRSAESHAQEPLGQLTRQGGCWANVTAKVCAWKLGTKPNHF